VGNNAVSDERVRDTVHVRVLKRTIMAVVAVTEVVLTSNEFEGPFKGVNMRHLRNVYPTLYCSHRSIKNALAELCEFGFLKELKVAGENCPRWVPTGQGRELAKRTVIIDERLYLYYPGIQQSDTRVTYERVRDIIRNQIQEKHIIREDDFYKTGLQERVEKVYSQRTNKGGQRFNARVNVTMLSGRTTIPFHDVVEIICPHHLVSKRVSWF
jgi:hypothetical protein